MTQCKGITRKGKPCKKFAINGSYCSYHIDQEDKELVEQMTNVCIGMTKIVKNEKENTATVVSQERKCFTVPTSQLHSFRTITVPSIPSMLV
jgi:hypothetical protein